ncbi:MAG: radical SAM protein [Syntrophomonadaceae bacterium]|nr:radical SAM protein [Syntrophomonadaceae bacterium]
MFNGAKKAVGDKFVEQLSDYMSKNPERNIEKTINMLNKLAKTEEHKRQLANAQKILADPDSNWHELYLSIMTGVNPKVRNRLAVNFLVHSALLGLPQQRVLETKLGHGIPWAILIDPTDRCNLRCKGCWAGEYTRKNDLDNELLDRIITEGEELHIHFYVLSGGEPLVRKQDIVKLAQKHKDSVFHVFTNGTLIDDKFAAQCVEAGNITFAISVDGFEEATDARRGQGVFQKIMQAADILKRYGLFYGFSTTYHRKNVEEVCSDTYIEMLIDKGFRFGWYFTYIPIGAEPDLEFMATPAQRAYAYERIHEMRQTKPIFIADFWNDGQATDGCIAGGRRYFHINAAGEVEPCAFIHYANGNIHNMSVCDALKTPLFRAYQQKYPFNENMLRPCPFIDNPQKLAECVNESCAHCTQQNNLDVNDMAKRLETYAMEWGQAADELWGKCLG